MKKSNQTGARSSEDILVALVEDDEELSGLLKILVDNSPGFQCQHTYPAGQPALQTLPTLDVDVVLMDIDLPDTSGIDIVRALKPKMETTDFIMLTVHEDDASLFNSICAGATGYLLKDTPPALLLDSIKQVVNGGSPMSLNIARRVLESFQAAAPSPLSDRETDVLRLMCDGGNYRHISEKLFISGETVRSHIKNIYRKLHVNSRAGAVKKAIEDKLI